MFGRGMRISVAASAEVTACGSPTLLRSTPEPISAALSEPAIRLTVSTERRRAELLPCEAPTRGWALSAPWRPLPKWRICGVPAFATAVLPVPTTRPCIVIPNLAAPSGA